MPSPILRVEGLKVQFETEDGVLLAVDGVNFDVVAAEALGIVGESGAGKSQTALAVLRLIQPPGHITAGHVFFQDRDLLTSSEREMRETRGSQISMIFQEPTLALNPVKTVGDQVVRVIRLHQQVDKKEAWERGIEMLHRVQIPSPEERMRQYPYQFSGGMCQRIAIAMALACNPVLLLADEPCTALDVTIQAQVMDLLERLRQETNTAVVLISHDLRLVTDFCFRILVMYGGRVVEHGPTSTMSTHAMHPYTQGLSAAIPSLDGEGRLYTIPGQMPDPIDLPPGCAFHPRCPRAMAVCRRLAPPLLDVGNTHSVACHLYA